MGFLSIMTHLSTEEFLCDILVFKVHFLILNVYFDMLLLLRPLLHSDNLCNKNY